MVVASPFVVVSSDFRIRLHLFISFFLTVCELINSLLLQIIFEGNFDLRRQTPSQLSWDSYGPPPKEKKTHPFGVLPEKGTVSISREVFG